LTRMRSSSSSTGSTGYEGVVANFFLKFYPKDPSKRKIKNYVPPEHKKLLNYI